MNPSWLWKKGYYHWINTSVVLGESATYLPLNLRTKLRKDNTTPYTSLASSSIEMTLPAAKPLCCVMPVVWSWFVASSAPLPLLRIKLGDPPSVAALDDVALEVEKREDEVAKPPKRLPEFPSWLLLLLALLEDVRLVLALLDLLLWLHFWK